MACKKTIVKRSMWLRGKGGWGSTLRHPITKKQCCMGFFAEQHIPRAVELLGNNGGEPGHEPKGIGTLLARLGNNNMGGEKEYMNLYMLNDAPTLTEKQREFRLSKEGLRHGIDFIFID